jgi:hypothetical protein
MIQVAPLFTNFYADRQHSLAELSRYGNKHLIFLTANNPGNVLDDVIAEVSGAFTAFVASLGDEEGLAALRMAANESRDNLRRSMSGPTGVVSRASGAVAGAFGKPSPDYTACFPLGVDGITKATNELMAERLENLRVALVARQANAAIAPHVTTITALKTAWGSLKAAAGTAAGAESSSEADRDAGREAVTKAFTRSALWLAWHFNGDESKFALYCPVYLLKNAQAQVPGTSTIQVTGGAGVINCQGGADGAETMQWSYRVAGTSGPFLPLGSSAPDEEVSFDTLAPGDYEVQAHGVNAQGDGQDSEVVTVTVT